jgi:hypothetical protein
LDTFKKNWTAQKIGHHKIWCVMTATGELGVQ